MADIKDGYGLPDSLPPLRLPADADLARQARAIPLVRQLAALAEWTGDDGRSLGDGDILSADAFDEAAAALGVPPARLSVLWTYALAVNWVEIGLPDEGDSGTEFAFAGEMAEIWARGSGENGSDEDALDAWASVFAAVLSEGICAAAGGHHDPADTDIHAPGGAVAMVLFMTRREGLYRAEARSLVRDILTGEYPTPHRAGAVEAWAAAHGEPADVLLDQLAEAGAVTLPDTDDGTVRFTPLALREMRNQLADEGVDIPLLPASDAELTAAQLLALADGIGVEEFESQADAWLAAQGPAAAAAVLLDLAARAAPERRLTAVSVVTRAGQQAEQAWRNHLDQPALRPYAKVALASLSMGVVPERPGIPGGLALLPDMVPAEGLAPELRPLADDLAWMSTDVLSLACGDDDTDPDEIAAAFAQAIPAGQEAEALDRIWRGPHPDAFRVLDHVGRFHPDKKLAKDARRAAHKAASHRAGGQ